MNAQQRTAERKPEGKLPRSAQRGKIRNLYHLLTVFPAVIFYMELVTRLSTYGGLTFGQFLYILFFSLSAGALVGAIVTLIRNRTAVRIVSIAVPAFLVILYGAHIVYFNIFGNYFDWENLGMAGEAATQFKDMLWSGIGESLFPIVLMILPVLLIALFSKRLTYYPVKRVPPMVTLVIVSVMMLGFLLPAVAMTFDKSEGSAFEAYKRPNDLETPQNFGILTATRLNFGRILFGIGDGVGPLTNIPDVTEPDHGIFDPVTKPSDGKDTTKGDTDSTDTDPVGTQPPDDPTTGDPSTVTPPDTDPPETTKPPRVLGDNVLDIDFDTLIANETNKNIKAMHKYFAGLEPTEQNEYTGYFEGKNLIFITLEGFCSQAIIPELTPTLYEMANGGFVFHNFYNSVWGGSTSTGEYANLTGLFYNKVKCMRDYIGTEGHYMPFTLGNQFTALGYSTYAFHANSYTYYGRDKSHPNLGYTYLGIGNGLENLTNKKGESFASRFKISSNSVKPWPTSDAFTAEVTIPTLIEAAADGPFHAYYMSISGHANYSFSGNAQSKAHREEVEAYCAAKGLDYSSNVKAYLACQIEVELMMQTFLAELGAAGILDDTVFVLTADHFPYGLTNVELAQLYGLPSDGIRSNFDLYRNSLIIWSSSMEGPVTVDVPCSAIDILPTVSNLFALPYDSRLMMGVDVFSDQEPLVILNCDGGPSWNWINRYGSYNSSTGFTVNPAYQVDEKQLSSYVKSMNALATARQKYAFAIIEKDYYSIVFGK